MAPPPGPPGATPAAGDDGPEADRAMDEDRAGDVRPADGRPAAGAGVENPTRDPKADEGEREPGGSPRSVPGR